MICPEGALFRGSGAAKLWYVNAAGTGTEQTVMLSQQIHLPPLSIRTV